MSAPISPPAEWFDAPEPDHPEPLTIDADGRVHGHLALWDSCHTGFMVGDLAQCIKPKPSRTGYRAFHLGSIEADDGTTIPVGRVVTAGGHASLADSLQAASRHYDKTENVGAFVRARDGRHGIYLTGAVRSDAPPEVVRDMRANPPSGDWRGMNGHLEMIAALSVPVPGFETPQLALTAAGEVASLILPGYMEGDEVEETVERPADRDRDFTRRKRIISTALTAAALTAERRNDLPARAFVFPKDRRYPIQDLAHARNALARSSGKPEEAQVRRAVCRRYPELCQT